jgi:hypothetical protein
VKQDRLSALRQRLKRGSFEFGALLEGVSTLEDEGRKTPDEARTATLEPPIKQNGSHGRAATAVEERVETTLEAPLDRELEAEPAPQLSMLEVQAPSRSAASEQERLRAALDSLACRLLQEMGSLRAALAAKDVEQGGFHLAHVNQVLDLLRDIDPEGEVSRRLGTRAAPPAGRSWPASCWSVVEFATSPISGLLPAQADESFARDLLYAAWGVTLAPVK